MPMDAARSRLFCGAVVRALLDAEHVLPLVVLLLFWAGTFGRERNGGRGRTSAVIATPNTGGAHAGAGS
eukprot:6208870-Pleurochrysis_carterae.AAC.5